MAFVVPLAEAAETVTPLLGTGLESASELRALYRAEVVKDLARYNPAEARSFIEKLAQTEKPYEGPIPLSIASSEAVESVVESGSGIRYLSYTTAAAGAAIASRLQRLLGIKGRDPGSKSLPTPNPSVPYIPGYTSGLPTNYFPSNWNSSETWLGTRQQRLRMAQPKQNRRRRKRRR